MSVVELKDFITTWMQDLKIHYRRLEGNDSWDRYIDDQIPVVAGRDALPALRHTVKWMQRTPAHKQSIFPAFLSRKCAQNYNCRCQVRWCHSWFHLEKHCGRNASEQVLQKEKGYMDSEYSLKPCMNCAMLGPMFNPVCWYCNKSYDGEHLTRYKAQGHGDWKPEFHKMCPFDLVKLPEHMQLPGNLKMPDMPVCPDCPTHNGGTGHQTRFYSGPRGEDACACLRLHAGPFFNDAEFVQSPPEVKMVKFPFGHGIKAMTQDNIDSFQEIYMPQLFFLWYLFYLQYPHTRTEGRTSPQTIVSKLRQLVTQLSKTYVTEAMWNSEQNMSRHFIANDMHLGPMVDQQGGYMALYQQYVNEMIYDASLRKAATAVEDKHQKEFALKKIMAEEELRLAANHAAQVNEPVAAHEQEVALAEYITVYHQVLNLVHATEPMLKQREKAGFILFQNYGTKHVFEHQYRTARAAWVEIWQLFKEKQDRVEATGANLGIQKHFPNQALIDQICYEYMVFVDKGGMTWEVVHDVTEGYEHVRPPHWS